MRDCKGVLLAYTAGLEGGVQGLGVRALVLLGLLTAVCCFLRLLINHRHTVVNYKLLLLF